MNPVSRFTIVVLVLLATAASATERKPGPFELPSSIRTTHGLMSV